MFVHSLAAWLSGIASAAGKEDHRFESRQGVRLLELNTLQCCYLNLNSPCYFCIWVIIKGSKTKARFFSPNSSQACLKLVGLIWISVWLEAAGAILFSSCISVTQKLRPSRQTCRLAHVRFWLKNWAKVLKGSFSLLLWNNNTRVIVHYAYGVVSSCQIKACLLEYLKFVSRHVVSGHTGVNRPLVTNVPSGHFGFHWIYWLSRRRQRQSCQIFLGTIYQNGENICTKMTTKYTKWKYNRYTKWQ
jgi:hypothetical protein